MKLRLDLTIYYDAKPEHYGTDDPAKAAEIDTVNLNEDPHSVVNFFDTNDVDIHVRPVGPNG